MTMRFMTRDTDCAMRALTFLSQYTDRSYDARELAVALRVPRPFMRKILQRLGGAGFLSSTRGRKGGFSLARKSGSIRLKDLIGLFQGAVAMVHCRSGSEACGERHTCLVHRRLKDMESCFDRDIGRLTIHELAAAQER